MSDNPYAAPLTPIESPEVQAARRKCEELARLKVSAFQIRSSLFAAGIEASVVDLVAAEYPELLAAVKRRERRLHQLAGLILFMGAGGLFLYFAYFSTMGLFVFPLLGLALWGLFKLLLP